MRNLGLLLLVVALSFGALQRDSSAQEGGGGGGWEKMSGPGWWAYGFAYYRICLKGEKKIEVGTKRFCELSSADLWLNLGGSYAVTGDENQPAVLVSPDMRALSFEPSVDYRLPFKSELLQRYPILVGGGVGVHQFWGEDVGFTRASLEWRVSFTFLRREGASVGFRYGYRYFLGGFSAADFGDPTGSYDTGSIDAVETISLYVTLGY